MTYYVIVGGDKFVGIDPDSGGYPYKTISPQSARFWTNYDEAEKYLLMFNKRGGLLEDCSIKEIRFTLINIDRSPVFKYKRRHRYTGEEDSYKTTRDELDRLYGEDMTFQAFLRRMNSYDSKEWEYYEDHG